MFKCCLQTLCVGLHLTSSDTNIRHRSAIFCAYFQRCIGEGGSTVAAIATAFMIVIVVVVARLVSLVINNSEYKHVQQ